jgi:SAM-dependent methyltransferase
VSDRDQAWLASVRTARNHREFVGPSDEYDLNGALQFSLLTLLGMRESHAMLDIGCGSLRGGRFFVMYLRPGHYCAIEPESWLVQAAIRDEIGEDAVRLKSPTFYHGSDFACRSFDRQFDFILAQGVFTHAPPADIARCLSEAAACMRPTSLFVANFMEGDSDYEGSAWRYPDVSRYTSGRIRALAAEAGLRALPVSWPHPRGATWVAMCRPDGEAHLRDLLAGLPATPVRNRPASVQRADGMTRRRAWRSLLRRGRGLKAALRRRMLGR